MTSTRYFLTIVFILLLLFRGYNADSFGKYAVVIGIGDYQDKRIRPLKYASADAKAIYDFLIDPGGGNFPRNNVRLLLNKNATQRSIRSALGTFLPKKALKDDMVFIYYAGHGAPEYDYSRTEPDGYSNVTTTD